MVSCCVLCFDFHVLTSFKCLLYILLSVFSPYSLHVCLPRLSCFLLCDFPLLSHLSSSLLPLLTCSSSPHQCVCVFKSLFHIHSLSVCCLWHPVIYPVSPPASPVSPYSCMVCLLFWILFLPLIWTLLFVVLCLTMLFCYFVFWVYWLLEVCLLVFLNPSALVKIKSRFLFRPILPPVSLHLGKPFSFPPFQM